jgi:hypothetical protein
MTAFWVLLFTASTNCPNELYAEKQVAIIKIAINLNSMKEFITITRC